MDVTVKKSWRLSSPNSSFQCCYVCFILVSRLDDHLIWHFQLLFFLSFFFSLCGEKIMYLLKSWLFLEAATWHFLPLPIQVLSTRFDISFLSSVINCSALHPEERTVVWHQCCLAWVIRFANRDRLWTTIVLLTSLEGRERALFLLSGLKWKKIVTFSLFSSLHNTFA